MDLMDDLEEVYWKQNYPIDPDTNQPYYRDSYFRYLASKHTKSNGDNYSFKGIEAFEDRYRPKWFVPPKSKKK